MPSRRAVVRTAVAAAASSSLRTLPAPAAAAAAAPLIGLGTCCDGYDTALAMVLEGVRTGYRLFDTAAHYESEPAVGAALVEARQRGLLEPSEELRTVTKIWFDDMGYEPALASAMRTLRNLRRERIDTAHE